MLNLLCLLACTWDSMIIGSARGHKPGREARMALCCCALQTCFAPGKAVCLQYRSIRVPTGYRALYTRCHCSDELSAYHWGVVGVSVCTVLKTLSVVYGIMPI